MVCVAEDVVVRFGGGIGGHEPPSSTKLDINNNKNNIVMRQRGGVRRLSKQTGRARREGWSWAAEATVLDWLEEN